MTCFSYYYHSDLEENWLLVLPLLIHNMQILISWFHWDILFMFQNCRRSNHEVMRNPAFKAKCLKIQINILSACVFWGWKKSNRSWYPKLIFPRKLVASKYEVTTRTFFLFWFWGFVPLSLLFFMSVLLCLSNLLVFFWFTESATECCILTGSKFCLAQ